jgi:protein-S-isoprenylcysteine O-methyltransferase Ste14
MTCEAVHSERLAVMGLHVLFWSVVGVRLAASARSSIGNTADRSIASRWSRVGLLLAGLSMGAFYPLFAIVWVCPSFAGPRLFPPSVARQLAGGGFAAAGIGLMAWSYSALRSFRLLAEIDSSHELCTHGPYAKLRHPVYLGIHLFYGGCFLLLPYAGFLLQAMANAWAYDFRARVEEDVMKRAFGETYRKYASRTDRLIPWIY